MCPTVQTELPEPGLLEDEVREEGLEAPIDHRDGHDVERGMRDHQHPDAARDREDAPEHEPEDRGLLHTR